jgi:hypothetical protein
MEFPKKEILVAYVSNLQICLGKITKKGNLMDYVSSQKWEIFPKNPENSKKNIQKFTENSKNGNPVQKMQNKTQ